MNKLDRTLALAGVFQSVCLVKQLAWTGKLEQPSFETSINSLFQIDAINAEAVYGKSSNLQLGLRSMVKILKSNLSQDSEIIRYGIAILHLERKLMKKKELLNIIGNGIKQAKAQAQIFGLTHQNVVANLANLYTNTLSTFNFRIHVDGEENYLTNANQTNKVRALLLSGVRSAVLWRQLGGNRLQIILKRREIISDAENVLTKYQTENELS